MIESEGIHYGIPLDADGVKLGKHYHRDETVDPDRVDRSISAADEAVIRSVLKYLPAANGRIRKAKTCLYTMTPDGDFLLDRVPGSNILVASPCSGHGFKFAPVIGEIVSQLVREATPVYDLALFDPRRFDAPGVPRDAQPAPATTGHAGAGSLPASTPPRA
jgi:sarcosine oxidase